MIARTKNHPDKRKVQKRWAFEPKRPPVGPPAQSAQASALGVSSRAKRVWLAVTRRILTKSTKKGA